MHGTSFAHARRRRAYDCSPRKRSQTDALWPGSLIGQGVVQVIGVIDLTRLGWRPYAFFSHLVA
ncbi:hypothetical protein CYV19_15435 [Natronobacterium gregoryi SP2]|uniref:Uncharacterized protein n=1 Tax=Natronobacterium gregoryi (strain ATCC 43098 / DSM 3393 / CCM 3738 / CIP 104747 / IAM 13177 / JCM 8860 / NBRC 102187 / NCIMB 2189 / SP2) TaxID=797304 RepID=L9YE61_NATGS|nr:hypothetical protein C490_04587 [Natronobacterium gregoryi SP2]PLK19358.1 hypothetical protein CYV19_15435 [Natronobacterium gregoryi SP2]